MEFIFDWQVIFLSGPIYSSEFKTCIFMELKSFAVNYFAHAEQVKFLINS
jgi:hypothetical protein